MLNLNAAKRRHILRMRRLDKVDKIKETGRTETPLPASNPIEVSKQNKRIWTKCCKILVFLLVYELLFPFLFLYHFFRSFIRLDDWLYEEGIPYDSAEHRFYVGCWFAWQIIKNTILYPFYFLYALMLDCRNIRADTSWKQLTKRLFI